MSFKESPLFEPVHWQGTGFKILDESRIPEYLEYIEVNDLSQALEAVREMKTRAYGQVLTYLYSVALLGQRYQSYDPTPLRQQIEALTQQFKDVRPTFDFGGLGSYVAAFFDRLPANSLVGESIARQAREFAAQITRGRSARAKRAATILPNPARVLTHCNVSGELVAVAYFCKEMGKELSVIATETRPYLQGARLTAWELAQAGVKVALIPDCAVAQVMARGDVNAVIVGADRSARNGDIINKVGTYPIAKMAKEYGVPFYALVQDPRGLERGSDVPIEERPAEELLMFNGHVLIDGNGSTLTARYPAFDMTPAALITHLVGFDGIYTPETFGKKYQAENTGAGSQPEAKEKYVLLYGLLPEHHDSDWFRILENLHAKSLLIPEMRPELWGAQAVAPALIARKVPVTLISDNMMGTLFKRGEIAKLCFYYRHLTEDGPIGIAGSLLAVQLARLHDVSVELLRGEERIGTPLDVDVKTFMGERICPANAAVYPLEPETVPWRLLSDQ
jgi:methylthioribose-1-phosphate isomerase